MSFCQIMIMLLHLPLYCCCYCYCYSLTLLLFTLISFLSYSISVAFSIWSLCGMFSYSRFVIPISHEIFVNWLCIIRFQFFFFVAHTHTPNTLSLSLFFSLSVFFINFWRMNQILAHLQQQQHYHRLVR